MGIGAVLRVELARSSRRKRTYLIRAIAAATMLLALWQSYEWAPRGQSVQVVAVGSVQVVAVGGALDPPVLSAMAHRDLPTLAGLFLANVAGFQLLLIPLIVPAMVAGAIAEEDRRRTMLDLLTTRLTSAEIALGKLAGRLAHVASAIAIPLPIAAIAGVYGGLVPMLVAAMIGLVAMIPWRSARRRSSSRRFSRGRGGRSSRRICSTRPG